MDRLGVIGGSGLYAVEGIEDAREDVIETPWGAPSDAILTGRLAGREMAFLPRHGRGHALSPSDVPYRANIAALKMLGCREVVALSACGSFREEMAPGHFVILDQFIDRTRDRAASFFGKGCVAHVSLAHPTCARLGDAVEAAAGTAGITAHRGGTYLAMEGPQFSTLAESRMFRDTLGADVIGMTNMPEAKLAREAELPYATLGMVTDYDCWHPDHGNVEVEKVLAVLKANAATAAQTVVELTKLLGAKARTPSPDGIETCLDFAIITSPDAQDPEKATQLSAILKRWASR